MHHVAETLVVETINFGQLFSIGHFNQFLHTIIVFRVDFAQERGLALSKLLKVGNLRWSELFLNLCHLYSLVLFVEHKFDAGQISFLSHDHVETKGIFDSVVVVICHDLLKGRNCICLGSETL